MPGSLQNKVLLISGTTGIAAATARLAQSEGAAVLAIARHAGELDDVFLGDLTEAATARDAVRHCMDRYGRIDCLFNVAGISARRLGDGPLHTCTEEAWDATFDTNVKSMFLLNRETLQAMLAQPPDPNGRRGVILNMASVAPTTPAPRYFDTHAYAISKGAVIAMTRVMATYYAPRGIRVNAIAPGFVRTPLTKRSQENTELLTYIRERQPLAAGMMEPDEVARAAVFLLSDHSRMITGDTLTIDAGWSIT